MSIEIFRDYKVLNNRSEIVTLSKFIHSFNRNMLFNRWVLAPSVVMNSNVYVIDDSNYRHLYSICLQRDIIKNQNRMSQYKSIQQMLISLSGFRYRKWPIWNFEKKSEVGSWVPTSNFLFRNSMVLKWPIWFFFLKSKVGSGLTRRDP